MVDPSVLLEQKGLKITPQRYAILRYLQQTDSHPTADQVVAHLNRELPMTSRATVYNTLKALCDVGLVQEVTHEAGVSRYDANIGRHHHFICRSCRRFFDVEWEAFGDLQAAALIGDQHTVDSIEVIVRGICRECQPS
jgi:Fe2+ or Zn2+ uptake regulation protein